jgi:hypothetical protein
MRTRLLLPIFTAALLATQAVMFAARADIPRHPMWLTFVDGAHRDIDGEWSADGHVAVLRYAAEPIHREIVYGGVWRGIDARVSPAESGLKYSFEVSPRADPRTIHLRYSGASRIELNDSGSLTIEADGGKIVATRPVAYQDLNGRRAGIPVRFVPFDADVAFSIGTYDHSRPLVIESVTKN